MHCQENELEEVFNIILQKREVTALNVYHIKCGKSTPVKRNI